MRELNVLNNSLRYRNEIRACSRQITILCERADISDLCVHVLNV